MRTFIACGLLLAAVAIAQDTTTPAPAVVAPVVQIAAVAESVKLASKDWRNYKGCDDTSNGKCD